MYTRVALCISTLQKISILNQRCFVTIWLSVSPQGTPDQRVTKMLYMVSALALVGGHSALETSDRLKIILEKHTIGVT